MRTLSDLVAVHCCSIIPILPLTPNCPNLFRTCSNIAQYLNSVHPTTANMLHHLGSMIAHINFLYTDMVIVILLTHRDVTD